MGKLLMLFFGNYSPDLQSTLGDKKVPDEELLARLLSVLSTNNLIYDMWTINGRNNLDTTR